MSAPFQFQRGTWYPFAYLEANLSGVSLAQFLVVLKLNCTGRNRMFQNGCFGDEILDAIESTTRRDKTPQAAPVEVWEHISAVEAANKPRKRGRPRKHGAKVHDLA